MGFFSDAFDFVAGDGILGSLVKTALLIRSSELVGPSVDPKKKKEEVDKGARLQLDPSPDNQIPVLYGEAYFGGNITDAVLAADYKKMTYCLALSEVTGNLLSTSAATAYTFKNVYLDNNRVVFKADGFTVDYTVDSSGNQDISARDLIKVYFYAGATPLQPSGKSGTTPASYTVMPGWTQATHPMTGLLYAVVEVTYSKDKNITGIPECTFNISSSMKLPGDVIQDYMTSTRYGAGIPSAELDSSFATLNSFASTGFTYTSTANASVNSPINLNGIVDTNQNVISNIQSMADCASSWLGYDISTGKWSITINRTGTSVASFTDSNIIGDISISGTSLKQLSNSYKVTYQNTDILDKSDFVKVSIPSGDWYGNEVATTSEITLPFTNKQVVATKIGLQALKQARVDKIIQFRADFSYINLKSGELIDVTSAIYGFTNKIFRIMTVAEIDSDRNTIELEFTCLEYEADVYAYNITEFTVVTDGGILGIGSIGKANTPIITKTEESNLPRINIAAEVPSGIVDTIEYWITTDTSINNDASRNYTQIATLSNPNGSLLTEDDVLTYVYSPLSQSDFFIKVRGSNNITSGPFSDPSGLVAYVPKVVADTVSDTPASINGLAMGLGLLTLLNNVDKLFSGTTGTGTLFDKIFSVFADETGVDIKAQAAAGQLGTTTGGTIDALTDVDTSSVAPSEGDYLVWNGSNWVPSASGGGGTATNYLSLEYFPTDRSTNKNALATVASDLAPITGDYWFTITNSLFADPSKGSGSIKLYKSNGTLVQTVSASAVTIDKNIVKISFNTRVIGTDYYILMDEGIVTANPLSAPETTYKSPAITTPTIWNFHTGVPEITVAPAPRGHSKNPCANTQPMALVKYETETKYPAKPRHTAVWKQSNIRLMYNQPIVLQSSGTITIKKGGLIDTTHQVINLAQTFAANKVSELVWVAGSSLYVNATVDFDKGATYYINMSANCVKNACADSGNTAISDSTTVTWVVDGGAVPESALPSTNTPTPLAETGLVVKSSVPIERGSGSMQIKDASGNVIKTVSADAPEISFTTGT